MKKLIFAVAVMLCSAFNAFAQDMTIPADPQIKKGVLPNGMTYYIRHNEWPEKRAFFYIAQAVGSMQENDDQRGLAHFLEHMCFNGTKNFPDNSLIKYLETIGVKFGENLNAYTSLDETVYNIDNVNVETPGAIDSCLLILHDWSHDLLLEDKEIDKERGVINEEWRSRSSAQQRMIEKALPEIYIGSKYAYRMPIGTMDVVLNFPYKAIKDYYKTWYRPDLQAIVIVGDVDVNETEAKIQKMFADIKAVENPATREYYPVNDNKEPIVSIQKDKEQQYSILEFDWKTEVFPKEAKGSIQYIIVDYVMDAMQSMFQERFSDIMKKENAPFIQASFGYGEYLISKTKAAYSGTIVFKDNGEKEAVQALYREILRAKRHGFTASEYERFKAEYLSQIEKQYNNREKIHSQSFINQCVRNFLDNEPMNNIEWEYATMNQYVPMIPLQAINQVLAQMPDSNFTIFGMMPDKEGLNIPAKDDILGYMKSVEAENIEQIVEEVNNDPLISNLPKACKIKSIKSDVYDSKTITLKNGIKIHVKKTDFSPNQISMSAVSWGGKSLYSNEEYIQADNADIITQGGAGSFSATDLTKKLSGIQASARVNIGNRSESVNGSCVKKDLETMLQLLYLRFTAPRMDTEALNSLLKRSKESLKNQELNPISALRDTITSVVYGNDIRHKRTKSEDLDKINLDRCMEIYKERFADGDDFEFYFVGDIDADSTAALLTKYIGALPTVKGSEKYSDKMAKIAKGNIRNVFDKEMETPQATILFVYNAPCEYTLRNLIAANILEHALDMHYTKTVREDEGGSYGVSVSVEIADYPEKIINSQFVLPTSPDKRERMTEIIYKGVDDIVNNGIPEESIQKAKEYLIRSHAENVKNNGYWMNQLQLLTRENVNFVDGYDDIVKNITAEEIRSLAEKLFKSGNCIEVGMTCPVK